MFNFFKGKKATITSISIPDFGWEQVKNDSEMQQWINPAQSIALSVNFFDLKPDLPTAKDINTLRDYYRNQIVVPNGGLIQVDLIDLKKYRVIKTIFKIPQTPSGMTYLASLTIPFKKCSYVVKIQAAEVGTTGLRDTLVADEFLKEGKITSGTDGFEGWFLDPYDPSFKEGTPMNLSEGIAYDAMFPEHPLSQARSLLAEIESQITFADELAKHKKFGK
ncbi:MAG: hypothetical protein JKY03_06880 [Aureispira sp.]|nr:hypothetical protein [Aureispira sp.]